jgi:glycosyltransferase involved in cell wall biosynthesis
LQNNENIMNLRIAHIVYSCVPGNYRGGVPKIVFELAQAQVAIGHEVMVYTTNYNSSVKIQVPLDKTVEAYGVKIRYFPTQYTRWFHSPELKKCLLSRDFEYDILHSHNSWLALNKYASEAKQKSGRPLFYHGHGAFDPIVINKGGLKRLRKLLYLKLVELTNYRHANTVFANTPNEVEQIRALGVRTPIHILPNGIRINEFKHYQEGAKAFRKRTGITEGESVILYLGRLVAKKGLHLLIPAFAEVYRKFPNTRLIIAGDRNQDPVYVAALDALVEENGIRQVVVWPGFLNETEKLGALGAASIFSHVTESEGMAMSVLEAMAAGLPTVVSKTCYMNEAVKAQAVIECEFGIHSLASVLAQLLENESYLSYLSQNARHHAIQKHSWQQIAKRSIEIYEQHL